MSTFEISTRTNGEFQFNLKASNGQVILTSEGYTTKGACQNGIDSVKKNSQNMNMFEAKESKNGKFYFVLKATNGQVIGQSEMYETAANCNNGMDAVKRNAADASVKEL